MVEDRNRNESREPKVIVEYVPTGRKTADHRCRSESGSSNRQFYYHTSTRTISPLGLAALAAAGVAALCLLLVVGSVIVFLTLGAGLVYMAWRRLLGKGRRGGF